MPCFSIPFTGQIFIHVPTKLTKIILIVQRALSLQQNRQPDDSRESRARDNATTHRLRNYSVGMNTWIWVHGLVLGRFRLAASGSVPMCVWCVVCDGSWVSVSRRAYFISDERCSSLMIQGRLEKMACRQGKYCLCSEERQSFPFGQYLF